jgi:AP endonuclease-1
MCGSGNTVGNEFSDMRKIIQQVRDKGRVGVCIDTCHTFAAGLN